MAVGPASRPVAFVRSGAGVVGVGERPAVLVELIGLVLAFLLFTRLHATAGKAVASATANALALQSVERELHVGIEQLSNKWLTEHPALIPLTVYCYRLYYAMIVGVLGWVFFRHGDIYRKVRRTLIAMAALVPK